MGTMRTVSNDNLDETTHSNAPSRNGLQSWGWKDLLIGRRDSQESGVSSPGDAHSPNRSVGLSGKQKLVHSSEVSALVFMMSNSVSEMKSLEDVARSPTPLRARCAIFGTDPAYGALARPCP
eukprot:2299065-Rhodomonas_salina.1